MPGAGCPRSFAAANRGGRHGKSQISITGVSYLRLSTKAPCPILALFFWRKGGKPQISTRLAFPHCPATNAKCSKPRPPRRKTWGTTDLNPPPRSRIRPHPPMNIPPFTSSTCPVIYAAASEARNFTACATSRSVPRRPSGICVSIAALTFSSSTAVMGVSM
jgi:hypothetical protein